MPTFGQYETAQRLHLTGVGALYALQSDPAKVIMVLLPQEGIWSEEQLREEIDGFLLRTKTQRNVAKTSSHWAPVHEVAAIRQGSDQSGGGGDAVSQVGIEEHRTSGAFAVMDRYERSAQSLIDGRVNLNNADLRNVMSGVIQGLIDMRKSGGGGRAHGNLKPSNILLTKSTDLASAVVHLADPAADGSLKSDSHQEDLADLGRILYELVNLRPHQGGAVGRSRDWDELGPNGEDWRNLCNVLLDADAPAEKRDLEKILAAVQTWILKPRKARLPILIAASILFILIAGSVALYIGTRPPKLDFNQQNWEKLCLSYYSWFGDFADHLSDAATRKKYSAEPYPTEVVALFSKATDLDKYQPRKLAAKPQSARDLAVSPTEDAKHGYAPYYTLQGVQLIEKVTAALTPETWPLLRNMDTTAATYEQRGWKKPAAGIRVLIASARPPVLPTMPPDIEARAKLVNSVDVFANIDSTLSAAQIVTQIDARWARIQEQLKKLPSTGVPLLAALPKFAEDFPRSEVDPAKPPSLADVQELAVAFDQVDQLVNQLVADFSGPERQIVFEELAKDPAAQVPADGKLTVAMFAALPQVARDYVKIGNDPRAATDWTKSLDDIQKQYINNIPATANDPNLPALQQRLAILVQEFHAFTPIVPIEKNRKDIEVRVTKAREDLASLNADGQKWVAPYMKKPAEVIAEEQAKLNSNLFASASPAVKSEWQNHHTALLSKLRTFSQGMAILPYDKYKEFDGKFKKLEETYTAFDKKIDPKIPGLSDLAGNDWRHTIGDRVATIYREEALKEIMTNAALKWSDDLPQTEDPAYLSYQKQRLDSYRQTCTDAVALIADQSAITDRLDRLQLLPADSAPAPSWRDLSNKWQPGKNTLLADAQIVGAIKPISDRVAALQKLDGVTDYQALLAQTASAAPEIALTAWRNLGSPAVTVSESTPALDDEEKAQAAVSAQLTSLSRTTPPKLDAARLTALTNELKSQGEARWRRYADTLSSPAAIQAALDRRATFNVTLNKQTDAGWIYDEALYSLLKNRDLPEGQLKPAAQAFVDNVKGMPASVSQDKPILELLERMTKSLSQSPNDFSSAGAGPQLANWVMEKPREGMRIFYFPSKAAAKYVLEFVQFQVGNKSIFLCTTEVSLGLFADTVNASGRFADLNNAGKAPNKAHWFKVSEDPWDGPRIWRITNNNFVANPLWLFKVPQMGETPYYPANAIPDPPSADLPMQALSPWSAMFVARLLGCRLPTSEEWKAAYDKNEAAGPKDAWNLRGAAWLTQFNYAKPLAGKGMKFPDDGIFLTVDQFFATPPIAAEAAKPWTGDALAKIAPARVTPGPESYKGLSLWFRKSGSNTASPGSPVMYDLVGNVAEYVYDGTADKPANAVIKDTKASVADVDAAIATVPTDARGRKTGNLFVIGGSALSPPQSPFNEKLAVDPTFAQTETGFADVGFRLAYTAPIDSIADILAAVFHEPKYFPGTKAKP